MQKVAGKMTAPNYDNPAFQTARLSALRRRLNRVGEEKGRLHPHTLALSRKVDVLVNKIMEEEELR